MTTASDSSIRVVDINSGTAYITRRFGTSKGVEIDITSGDGISVTLDLERSHARELGRVLVELCDEPDPTIRGTPVPPVQAPPEEVVDSWHFSNHSAIPDSKGMDCHQNDPCATVVTAWGIMPIGALEPHHGPSRPLPGHPG